MNDLYQKLTVQRLSAALIAFFVLAGLSVLVVYFADPTIYTFSGVLPDPYPVWYSLYRMGIALIQVGIGIWMIRILYHDGVWGMGRKKHAKLPSHI